MSDSSFHHLPRYFTAVSPFHRHADRLATCDYLFYVDADMECVAVGDEILGACCGNPSSICEYAFSRLPPIATPLAGLLFPAAPKPIFKIVFRVAKVQNFCASRRLARRIRADLREGVMPLWHDESHMNRYMVDHPPTRMLHPGYAFPDWWEGFPFPRRLLRSAKTIRLACGLSHVAVKLLGESAHHQVFGAVQVLHMFMGHGCSVASDVTQ